MLQYGINQITNRGDGIKLMANYNVLLNLW